MSATAVSTPGYTPADFADSAACAALAARLAPFGIRLDAGELALLHSRLGRVPRWAELVIMNTMWSEHCSYKSTRHLLKRLPTEAPQVVLGPGEDAGAVAIGEHDGRTWLAVLAHESHNHPSQIVPYEGAATGVGGIVRDVYCMGADVVGVLDALRLGTGRGPGGGLAAREILDGVVSGIADYGNALGVPNLGGDLEFHAGYDANVLVNVIALGVVDAEGLVRSRVPGPGDWAFVLVGKPTDASGFGGASFSSGVLGGAADQRGAVQLPDPFLKRVLVVGIRAVLAWARAGRIPIGFKDLGAGGIACVTSELADAGGMGVDLWLDAAHRVADPLPPEVLLCAETQERFCFIVPWERREEVVAVFRDQYRLGDVYPGAGASVIGRSRADGAYRATWEGEVVVDCATSFLTSGVKRERPAEPPVVREWPEALTSAIAPPIDLAAELRAAVALPGLCSRAALYQRYDPNVQGRTAARPGDADAGVIVPVPGARFGLAIAVDGNPRLAALDARLGAAHAVYEAARNVVAVGAYPIALTDCLNYGRPDDPRVMGQLEAGIAGLAEAARAVGTLPEASAGETAGAWRARVAGELPPLPFVSGNVSLYNGDHAGNAIPPSAIVACLGRLADASRALSPGLKQPGNALLLVTEPRRNFPRLGGSQFLDRRVEPWPTTGGTLLAPPAFDAAVARRTLALVLWANARGLLRAAHDVSDGGVAQALLEMSFAAAEGLGFRVENSWITDAACRDVAWFGEEPGFVLEVSPDDVAPVTAACHALGLAGHALGHVTDDGQCAFDRARGGATLERAELLAAWQGALGPRFAPSEEPLA